MKLVSWKFQSGGQGGIRGYERSKTVKKSMKRNWNFQRVGGGGLREKIPSMEKMWIFSGTTPNKVYS